MFCGPVLPQGSENLTWPKPFPCLKAPGCPSSLVQASAVSSFSYAEVPEDDVQDLFGAPSTMEAGQVSPGDSQCLGCQGYICSLLVVTKGIQATLEVMLVPCPRQKWWASGWVPTPARDKEHGLS